MSQNKDNLSAEAPTILKQIRWFQLHWKEYWKLIILAAAILLAAPIYTFSIKLYHELKNSEETPKDLGTFEFIFENSTGQEFSINNTAEFYVHAPESPGQNRRVSSGLMQLELASGYSIKVEPNETVQVSGKVLNEKRILPYIDAGEFFALVIFSASPKPIRTEIVLTRENISNGIKFKIQG
jgi:hypothetical protein